MTALPNNDSTPQAKAPKLADDLLDGADAAAAYLGLNRRQIYRMVESDSLPHVRLGRSLFFRKSALDGLFAKGLPDGPVKPPERIANRANLRPSDACTFSELVPVLMELFEAESDQLQAIIGRAKHLQRLGIARGGMGKGYTAFFGYGELRRMLMAVELCHLGISPLKAVEYVNDSGATLFGTSVVEIKRGHSSIIVNMDALRDVARKHLPWMFDGRRA